MKLACLLHYKYWKDTFYIFSFLILGFSNTLQAQDVGEKQYKQCVPCHGEQGEGNKLLEAPSIAGLPAWYLIEQLNKFRNGYRGTHPRDIPGQRMLPMSRTFHPEKTKPIADYVASLAVVKNPITVQGSIEKGKTFYATCAACHGAQGEGNEQLKSPPIAQLDDWYLVTQLKNFQRERRGYNAEKDPNGAAMIGMSKLLADDQAIRDVVSYIKSLK